MGPAPAHTRAPEPEPELTLQDLLEPTALVYEHVVAEGNVDAANQIKHAAESRDPQELRRALVENMPIDVGALLRHAQEKYGDNYDEDPLESTYKAPSRQMNERAPRSIGQERLELMREIRNSLPRSNRFLDQAIERNSPDALRNMRHAPWVPKHLRDKISQHLQSYS